MKFYKSGVLTAAILMAIAAAGCGTTAQQGQSATAVNSYKITASDTQVPTSFTGNISAQTTAAVRARVSGHVVEKYVQGGETVVAGQPLFRLDARTYEANLANARASAAQANAAFVNADKDSERYRVLAEQGAVSQQTYDNQASTAAQSRAAYEASAAQVRLAEDNLEDTIVYAPFDGTLEMDDIDLGTFVTAGSTTLVTINSENPVAVDFSMSETEYLALMNGDDGIGGGSNLQLQLSDGSIYAYTGSIVQAGKNIDTGTGKIQLKASFPNPDRLLLPGMYATVVAPGKTIRNAILVPSRALLQVLDKNFLMVVKDGKIEQMPVQVGATQGIYTVVTGGIEAGAEIVVDGLTKVRNGSEVKATLLTKGQVESGSK